MSNSLSSEYTNPESGLTEKDEYFLSILFAECGGDFSEALQKSGINESPFSVKKRLRKELIEATKNYLTGASAEAAVKLVSVLSNPSAPGNKTLLTAAKEILDRGGVNVTEEVKATENYIFILPPKDSSE